ncbi:hypothetical protein CAUPRSCDRAFT_6004 [Caulochytrium protostelioides]|uniref:C2H2-type domain-containing protein n=1 Tax=Caulochytrium protostelioides TaxID=1555241 RepID=A0A4P9WWJ0_9FUNG|nr:hypothetical protein CAUPRSCDRAFT_6004 [Caulochytrium protostelioides]
MATYGTAPSSASSSSASLSAPATGHHGVHAAAPDVHIVLTAAPHEPRFRCFCGKQFHKLCGYRSHARSHSGQHGVGALTSAENAHSHHGTANVTPSLPCHRCGKSFLRRQDLKRHIATHDASGARYICPYCSVMFSRSDALFRHVKTRRCRMG